MTPLELEEILYRAWPAGEVVDEQGFRLRAAGGVTRRANSVWAHAFKGRPDALDASIAFGESFYEARGLPPTFRITPASRPPELDSVLAARGYVVDGQTTVETAAFEAFRMAGQPPQISTSVTGAPGDDWLRISVEHGRFAAAREPYLAILGRIGDRAGYALARWKGKPVAAGLGVIDGEWLGIFGMLTLPEARRRRAATAILGALVGWAGARGATRAYLQVEAANDAARALYTACGFSPLYDYHYRVKPGAGGE